MSEDFVDVAASLGQRRDTGGLAKFMQSLNGDEYVVMKQTRQDGLDTADLEIDGKGLKKKENEKKKEPINPSHCQYL